MTTHQPFASLLGCDRRFCLAALSAHGGAAQTVEQFYKGKTINFLVASVPGGVNDLIARLISRHLGSHIPGNPDHRGAEPAVVRAGAGQPHLQQRRRRTASRSRSSSAARRRSPSWATPTRASTRSRSPGSAACRPTATTPIRSRSMRASTPRPSTTCASPTGRPRKIGTTGAGATNGIFTNIAKDVLGLNIQHVRGYRGAADVFLAQQRERGRRPGRRPRVDQGRAAGAVEGGRVPAADHVRAHHALCRNSPTCRPGAS